MSHRGKNERNRRRGVATVEAAILISVVLLPLMLGVCELGWYANSAQLLNNAARQGARAAVYLGNSNAEVEAAVVNTLSNSMAVDPDAVSVSIWKLTSEGDKHYRVNDLSENEQGHPIRVEVAIDYGLIGFATNMLGLQDENLSSYAVMRRQK